MEITFDLETLSTTNQAPIVQIGAVAFEDMTIYDKFLRTIKIESLEGYGFILDYRTIKWWLGQEKKAINSVFFTKEEVTLDTALNDFNIWYKNVLKNHSLKKIDLWSHATFDPPILMNNYKKVGLGPSMHYRQFKDIRTLSGLANLPSKDRGNLIHHNALDDSIYQAGYISEMLKKIKSK